MFSKAKLFVAVSFLTLAAIGACNKSTTIMPNLNTDLGNELAKQACGLARPTWQVTAS